MTDWADEIALDFGFGLNNQELRQVAIALRKAKADGVRDAIDKIYSEGGGGQPEGLLGTLTVMADAIERGEPLDDTGKSV